jgi:hypothetical protein
LRMGRDQDLLGRELRELKTEEELLGDSVVSRSLIICLMR